jgi:2-polyprenyl-3-methyl-5-hydroxy-6-metoxy-1,4-benzoquinol methylase
MPGDSATDVTPIGNVFDKNATKHPLERRMVDGFHTALLGVIPTGVQRALDVGCGEGNHTADVLSTNPSATVAGIDIAEANWLAKFHAPPRRVSVADASALPFASHSFDLVIALEVLEHVPDPRRALREIARVCDGWVILSVPWEPVWRLGNLARGRYVREFGNTPGHIQHFSRRGFLRTVKDYFDVDEIRRPVPWTLVRARK